MVYPSNPTLSVEACPRKVCSGCAGSIGRQNNLAALVAGHPPPLRLDICSVAWLAKHCLPHRWRYRKGIGLRIWRKSDHIKSKGFLVVVPILVTVLQYGISSKPQHFRRSCPRKVFVVVVVVPLAAKLLGAVWWLAIAAVKVVNICRITTGEPIACRIRLRLPKGIV